jgi:DNA-binding NtrC family response regulator
MSNILIVDDNEYIRYTLTNVLEASALPAKAVESGPEAFNELKNNNYDLVILDLKLPGMDGIEILNRIRQDYKDIPVIMLTAFGDIKTAVDSIKMGAYDFITKPFDNDQIIITINKALENRYLNKELQILSKRLDKVMANGENSVIGESQAMRKVFDQVNLVAPTNMTVVIQGESGTGKEVIANLIHKESPRKDKMFVAVDCGALPESLIESELFGHEKGSFTGATGTKEGKFEIANGGTIFLDEITNLTEGNQMKLLRAIQERKIFRIGSKKEITLDVRIIAASNMSLEEAVNEKKFRHDLFYRLSEFIINLPSLKERKEDIPHFTKYFIEHSNRELNKNINDVSSDVMRQLQSYHWPGNVREFRNVIRRAVLMTSGQVINNLSLMNFEKGQVKENDNSSKENLSLNDYTKKHERELIINALMETNGNKTRAAQLLNMNERTFYRRLKNLEINEEDYIKGV